ncbi:MAG: cytidine deaminase [Xanthobacteraceae bacterium]|jgi:cytidine deaminase
MEDKLAEAQKELLNHAITARESAYAPYSHFKVGAAVRTKSGKVFSGCNVENASYGLSICAERVAIFNAVSSGDPEIVELALFTDAKAPSRPCGACRQVLFEFAKSAKVIMGNKGATEVSTIQKLFPEPFELDR